MHSRNKICKIILFLNFDVFSVELEITFVLFLKGPVVSYGINQFKAK
jgi:hypothetical protein